MAKLFIPSVRRPVCSHANDSDFRFCQRCGYRRRVLTSATTKPPSVDLASINKRLQQLLNFDQATSYSKRKDSLLKELEAFSSAPPGRVPLATVCRFLIFKDKDGRTQVHRNSCKFIGQRGKHSCGCPLRLSYNTVDSYIGKLRSIFHAIGRDGEWGRRLGLGNLAADKCAKDYFRVVTAEQLQARITPKQATPFFVDKLTPLSLFLDRQLGETDSPLQNFIIGRDQAYFRTAFFSGDRPGDLGQVKVPEILRFPMMMGFCLIISGGKLCEMAITRCLELAGTCK